MVFYFQNLLNSVLNNQTDSPNNNQRNDLDNGYDYSSWITNEMRNSDGPVLIKLLCGADLLESFATPGLWADEDVRIFGIFSKIDYIFIKTYLHLNCHFNHIL